ncbi:MAG: ABC transporter substrate-binding protein [Oscillospiraceae bacterium]|nr:ABC transporter substrate-binding protein [Oscillospiraceae bacterium]
MKKHTLKKFLAAACACALALSMTACTSGGDKETGEPTGTGTQPLKVGILQYAPHPSLDNCYQGIVQGLEEAGFKDGENIIIDYQNGNSDAETNNMVAANFVSQEYDLIIAVATPAAMSAYAAAKDAGVPVVFTAVSDPVSAGLVQSMEAPNSGATGSSDSLNLEGQMALIRAMMPEADTIGILYTTSEPNSLTHLRTFEELAPEYGFKIESVGITDSSEVASGAAALVGKGVDCVNNFTDNNVVNQLSVLLNATNGANIPVFGSEEEQVRNGCVAAENLDYVALGRTTGKMAADILNGADVNTMPVAVVSDTTPVYSESNCAKFGITLPEAYSSAANLDAE